MPESTSSVVIPALPVPFRHPMTRLRERLAGAGSIKIAAIGSSTTAGEGGIVPYPQRLETFLRTNANPTFKGRNFDVLNRGLGAQEAPDERDRMQQDVMKGFGAVPKRGAEVGGILLGRTTPGDKLFVTIDDYVLVPIE